MKLNPPLFTLIVYVAAATGMAIGQVGQPMDTDITIMPWWAPLEILAVVGLPGVLGYFAGKDND